MTIARLRTARREKMRPRYRPFAISLREVDIDKYG